jgi:nucleotide-binding universal stress UspA family protein
MKDKPAVIIPLDGSEAATAALGAAQAISAIMHAVLYIVHVNETRLTEEKLAEEIKIVEKLKIKDFSIKQIIGENPADEILRFATARDAQMIVMSTHGKSFNANYLLGSVTINIVQRAIQPVMLIRPGTGLIPDHLWRPNRMLVPQNGTPASASIMNQVFMLARETNAEIDVLNVGTAGVKPPTEAGTIRTPMYLDHPRYDWPAWAREFAGRFFSQKPPDVKLNLFEREGDPPVVIKDFADQNKDNLILMGWHGQFGEGRARIVKELLQSVNMPIVLLWARE